jgi:ubiquinone/menaquinone biosynthesis C-methylase UbiE
MSTYILMKILESAPARYDQGIRILTLGKLDAAYDRLTSHIQKGQRVLDLGCGTGALTLKAARRGARVKGIDINSQMLDIAQKKAADAGLSQQTKFQEKGVAELGDEEPETYDAITSGLCFSELSEDEIAFGLKEAQRILRPGGLLLVADEVRPGGLIRPMFNSILRLPLAAVTYLFTQTTTHQVRDLPEKVKKAGFRVKSSRLNALGDFIELVAIKPIPGQK